MPAPGRARPLFRSAILAALSGWPLLLFAPAGAQPQAPTDAGASSAAVAQAVMGIISYTRWPVEPAELRLCVVGPTDYADVLLQGATQPSGRPVRARRLALDEAAAGAACDVAYVGSLGEAERRQLAAGLAGHPVLSISERDEACSVGSMVCLRVQGAQVSFQINLDSVARSGVRVSPKVLQLGQRKGVPP